MMLIKGRTKDKCASCQLIGHVLPLTASGNLLDRLRQILDRSLQHQRGLSGHSPDHIEGTFASCRKPPGFVRAELQHQGIDQKTLRKVPIRRANVVWCGAHRFEFAAKGRSLWSDESEHAFVILVRDTFGQAVDIAAWDPQTNRVGTWLGAAYALGQGSVFGARLSDGLRVHRTVMNYLRAGGNGIVILNYEAARNYLTDAGPLIAEDQQHCRELTAALTHPLPRILLAPAATKEG